MPSGAPSSSRAAGSQAGFSLAELLVATAILLIVSGAVVSALLQMTNAQATIWNRTQMHSGVRSATELLQQEVGQAGRVSLPASVTLTSNASANGTTMVVSSITGMFVGENLIVGAGLLKETVHVSAIVAASKTVTIDRSVDATNTQVGTGFQYAHNNGAAVSVTGGFTQGIIPPTTYVTNGSTASVLKLFGDINADGNMEYIEYSVSPTCICSNTCSPTTTVGSLYRNEIAFDAAAKPALTADLALLGNITANPGGASCFNYQMDSSNTYVLDVAITLTVQTGKIDPVTRAFQTETKALLNVSPRNVVNTWELAAHNAARVQTTPSTVVTLMGL